MTQLLQKALSEVGKLEESEQDAIATLILEELADEERWQASFQRSQAQLARVAGKCARIFAQAEPEAEDSTNCDVATYAGLPGLLRQAAGKGA